MQPPHVSELALKYGHKSTGLLHQTLAVTSCVNSLLVGLCLAAWLDPGMPAGLELNYSAISTSQNWYLVPPNAVRGMIHRLAVQIWLLHLLNSEYNIYLSWMLITNCSPWAWVNVALYLYLCTNSICNGMVIYGIYVATLLSEYLQYLAILISENTVTLWRNFTLKLHIVQTWIKDCKSTTHNL